ncbi:MAG: hypothetical protein IPG28_15370 [Betaproteobacteria bacterium]|nr:hypothetical protein [Betaproteobacteria bacterium]
MPLRRRPGTSCAACAPTCAPRPTSFRLEQLRLPGNSRRGVLCSSTRPDNGPPLSIADMANHDEIRPPDGSTGGIPDPPLPFTGGRIPASEEERAWVERRVATLQIAAPAVSFVALVAGFSLGWPRLAAVGVAGLGLTAIALGRFAIRERRLMFIRGALRTPRPYRYFLYEGMAAIPFGLALAIAGLGAILLATLQLFGVGVDAMRDAALARPGVVLVPLGALLLCQGLGFAIGFRGAARSTGERLWLRFLHLPAFLGGAILVALGAATLTLGAFELLAPDRFDRAWASIRDQPSALFR